MNKLAALCFSALSLYGCEPGGSTFVDRVQVDGADVLHSRVVAHPAFAHFDCIASASGQCHYALFDDDCAAPPSLLPLRTRTCGTAPVEQFSLSVGEHRRMPWLPPFRPCVSTEDAVPRFDCRSHLPVAGLQPRGDAR
ncbi:MAG: hypothetical protein M3Q42_12945 [Pseudomonadota bacterium]|nr:hypothetical protein [Pseudomonadota bacterium]